uniref:Uncharacterized protein n=1 Tax=Solanum lycopersicum TaxID=4081 RepID=A0A494G921_SOLLC
MAYIPGSTFLENNRIEGSGAYKWNVCYAIRTVRLPGLASLSLPCRGRSIPKKGSSYLKGIPKRASSLFRISAILSARAASSVSGLHVFHSELPPLTRACLRLDRLDTSYIRRIIEKSVCAIRNHEPGSALKKGASVFTFIQNKQRLSYRGSLCEQAPNGVNKHRPASCRCALVKLIVRMRIRFLAPFPWSQLQAPTEKRMKTARQANARTAAFKPERGPGLGIGLGAAIEFVQSKGKGDDYQF